MKKKIRNLILVLIISAVIIASIILIGNKMNANAVKTQQEAEQYQDWLSETCECLAKTRPGCTLDGFEYNATRDLCVNSAEMKVTYPLLKCSVYNCSGQNVTWNNKTWEPKLNE